MTVYPSRIDHFISHVFPATALITCDFLIRHDAQREPTEHSGTITTFIIFILGQISSNHPEIFISLMKCDVNITYSVDEWNVSSACRAFMTSTRQFTVPVKFISLSRPVSFSTCFSFLIYLQQSLGVSSVLTPNRSCLSNVVSGVNK